MYDTKFQSKNDLGSGKKMAFLIICESLIEFELTVF